MKRLGKNVLGVKTTRVLEGGGGETTKGENRGETTLGEAGGLGAERLVTLWSKPNKR